MEDNKKSMSPKTIGLLILVLGVVAAILAYTMVFSPYNTKIAEKQTEIDAETARNNELDEMISHEKEKTDETEENYATCDKVVSKYGSNFSTASEIIDVTNLEEKADVKVYDLSIDDVVKIYDFNNAADWIDSTSYTLTTQEGLQVDDENFRYYIDEESLCGYALSYSFTISGEYEACQKAYKELYNLKDQRKVPTSVTYSVNNTNQKVTMNVSMKEFIITGEYNGELRDNVKELTIPAYGVGSSNVFFSDALKEEE